MFIGSAERRRGAEQKNAVVLVGLVFLAACGPSKNGSTGADPAAPPHETVEVVVPVVPDEPEVSDSGGPRVAKGDDSLNETMPLDIEKCIRGLRDNPAGAASEGDSEYQQALLAERSGDSMQARKGYLQVVQKYPQSALIPASYFAFGEIFFNESKADPMKLPLASQSYQEVLKYPLPANKFQPIASYRLGVAFEKDKPQEALAKFVAVTKAARDYPNTSCAKEVSKAALKASISVFASIADEKKALAFYSAMVGKVEAPNALVQLAEQYVARGMGPQAVSCFAGSIESATKMNVGDDAQKSYCVRVKTTAKRIEAIVTPAQAVSMQKAVSAACP